MSEIRFSILEICEQAELEESQVRRAFKDLKDFFKPYSKRGEANKILFDQNALVIFKRLKEINQLQPSFSESLRTIQAELTKIHVKKVLPTPNIQNDTTDRDLHKEIEKARWNEREAEHKLELAEHQLEQIKSNLKALPAGGDASKLVEMRCILSSLEEITKPRFRKGTRVKELWTRLNELLK